MNKFWKKSSDFLLIVFYCNTLRFRLTKIKLLRSRKNRWMHFQLLRVNFLPYIPLHYEKNDIRYRVNMVVHECTWIIMWIPVYFKWLCSIIRLWYCRNAHEYCCAGIHHLHNNYSYKGFSKQGNSIHYYCTNLIFYILEKPLLNP